MNSTAQHWREVSQRLATQRRTRLENALNSVVGAAADRPRLRLVVFADVDEQRRLLDRLSFADLRLVYQIGLSSKDYDLQAAADAARVRRADGLVPREGVQR